MGVVMEEAWVNIYARAAQDMGHRANGLPSISWLPATTQHLKLPSTQRLLRHISICKCESECVIGPVPNSLTPAVPRSTFHMHLHMARIAGL